MASPPIRFLITSALLFAMPLAESAAQIAARDSALNACISHDTTTAWRQISVAWQDDSARHWSNDFLRQRLIALGNADQAVRGGVGLADSVRDWAFVTRMSARDSLDAAALRTIIARYGWPTRSMVGATGADAAFLIAQHNSSLQREALRLMRSLPAGEFFPSNLALLEDRIRVNEGKPQLYGTQLKESKDGKPLVFDPIEDIQNLDVRRAAVGLQPIALYNLLHARRLWS